MIRCVGVRKQFRQGNRFVEALRGADLSIEGPGFHAIMGPSGSGKSTMLHLFAGLDWPDAGEIHIDGKRIDALDDRALTRYRRHDIGVVFQQFNLIPTLTARENVELPGLLASEPRDDRRARSMDLLSQLDLADRADHRPDALSGGEQQRVAIARGLFFAPSVLFADEPTGNLDTASSDALWRLLRKIAVEQQMSVVMVTHEPEAAAHCMSVHVLRDGVVVERFTTEGLDGSGVADRYRLASG